MLKWNRGGYISAGSKIIYGGKEDEPRPIGVVLPWPVKYRLKPAHWWKLTESKAHNRALPILSLQLDTSGAYIVGGAVTT